jgi:gamma-glutamyltranspeptidase/glutathione hydrolase
VLPLLGLWLMALPLARAQTQADPEQGASGRQPMRAPAVAAHAMVAAANPHATRAGLEILRAGGNAVDAAVAALLVLNVVEPQSSGIGGGGFFLIWDHATRRVAAIDGRETAPAATTPELLLQADGTPQPFYPQRITGGRPVGVPGLLRAMDVALRRFGTRSLAQVAAPAIALAEAGFVVSPRLAQSLAQHRERLALFPATREVFFRDGEPVVAGHLLRQPLLARTLRLLAAQGADAFYAGPLADAIVAAVREAPMNPGFLGAADLAAYRAPLREPVRAEYRGFTVVGMPPPTSGGVTLLQILQLLDLQPPHGAPADAPQRLHRFVQAVRLAYVDRARYLADPDQVPVPVAGLLDAAYARRRAAALDWDGPLRSVVPGLPDGVSAHWGRDASPELPSTTHLVVVDEARNVVSVTASVEQAFGIGMVVPGGGFLLNNQLTDFSATPTDAQGHPVANAAAPGKRPRSSMAPTLVLRDGRPVLALGSPGGARIIQYVAWALVQLLDDSPGGGRDVQAAVAAPHVTHLGGQTVLEPPLADPATLAALRALGHEVTVRAQNSGLHVIRIDPETGLLHGGADPRREGLAAGY